MVAGAGDGDVGETGVSVTDGFRNGAALGVVLVGVLGRGPVESARSAVPVLPPVRFSVPLAEPGVPVSEYRALHGLCRSGVVEAGPGVGDRVASVAVAGDRHRLEVEQFDPAR